jgi:SAM-dependent methyltransferase
LLGSISQSGFFSFTVRGVAMEACATAHYWAREIAAVGHSVRLVPPAMQLHRLIFELRWPDGPRALRMVLPLARMFRRLKGTRPPDVSPAPLVTVEGILQGGLRSLTGSSTVAAPKRSLRARLAWLVYWPLRPIVRPAFWRLRAFMIGELIERLGRLDQRLVGLAEAPSQQHPSLIAAESRDDGAAAEMRRLASEMERTLLTLALERAPEPWHVAPADRADNSDGLAPAKTPASAIDMSYVLHRGRTAFLREIPKGATVFLSAGCAGGWFFDWVEECYGDIPRHIGLEYYAPRPDALPANVEWIENTCSDMSGVSDSSCDVVFSGENLEHLWTDEAIGFFLEAARVTRPGGLLVMDSPNRSITEALRTWSHPEHTVELTTAEAVEVTELAGFDIVTVKGIWLSRNPSNGEVLPFQHTDSVPLSLEERLIGGVARPEDAFLWWIEARRADRAPNATAISKRLTEIFAKAWPERTTRSVVGVGHLETGSNGEWVVCPPNTSGPLIFGPYMPLRAGQYRCTFELEGGTPAARARCDVAVGVRGDVLVSREITVGPERETVSLEFEVPVLQFGFQFRCFSLGGGGLRCRRVAQFEELTEVVPA